MSLTVFQKIIVAMFEPMGICLLLAAIYLLYNRYKKIYLPMPVWFILLLSIGGITWRTSLTTCSTRYCLGPILGLFLVLGCFGQYGIKSLKPRLRRSVYAGLMMLVIISCFCNIGKLFYKNRDNLPFIRQIGAALREVLDDAVLPATLSSDKQISRYLHYGKLPSDIPRGRWAGDAGEALLKSMLESNDVIGVVCRTPAEFTALKERMHGETARLISHAEITVHDQYAVVVGIDNRDAAFWGRPENPGKALSSDRVKWREDFRNLKKTELPSEKFAASLYHQKTATTISGLYLDKNWSWPLTHNDGEGSFDWITDGDARYMHVQSTSALTFSRLNISLPSGRYRLGIRCKGGMKGRIDVNMGFRDSKVCLTHAAMTGYFIGYMPQDRIWYSNEFIYTDQEHPGWLHLRISGEMVLKEIWAEEILMNEYQ